MNRIFSNPLNAKRILQLTADTLILIQRDGICIDIDAHSDFWFLQENFLLGNNIFKLLPKHTLLKIKRNFDKVINSQINIEKNYRLELNDTTL